MLKKLTHDGGGFCGIGYVNSNPTSFNASLGFSVTAYNCVGGNRSFAHELGHNMGLKHDRHVDNSNTACSENHGYVNQAAFVAGANINKRWRTILAYNAQCAAAGFGCSRLGYWSNPSNFNTGDPMGSSAAGNEADNSYILNRSMCLVADFRERPIGTVTTGSVTCSGNNAIFNLMFPTTNGSGAYNVYNSTTIFTPATLVGSIVGQPANGNLTIPIIIPGPTTAGSITLTIRDANNPGCDATATVSIPVCPMATPCSLTANGLLNTTCNDNGTSSNSSDDYITFSLNPAGANIGTTYSVTVSGGTITPTTGTYGSASYDY